MTFNIRNAEIKDKQAIADIFNFYIENTQAAFFETKVDDTFYDMLLKGAAGNSFYVVENSLQKVIGWGLLKKYHMAPAFNRVAELTYFFSPECTGMGTGKLLLDKLESDCRTAGIDTVLAKISSLNPQSIRFHEKNGFLQCGCFKKVARKFEKDVDVIWMQKFIV